MSAQQTKALIRVVEPVVVAGGAYFEGLSVRSAGRRRLVRVVVDEVGGLSLDRVAEISREVSRALDEQDVLGDLPYVLEVTSPGVDRPLTLPRHWEAAQGRLVRVRRRDDSEVTGRVVAVDDAGAELEVGGQVVRVGYAEVARALVQVEFSRIEDVDLGDEDEDADPDAALHAADADAAETAGTDRKGPGKKRGPREKRSGSRNRPGVEEPAPAVEE